jgi:hypothetical protein
MINSRLPTLTLLNKYDFMWFDIWIESRTAVMTANFFVGENMGDNIFKIGFLCLRGIAHLPEAMARVRFYRKFEIRPVISTDLKPCILEDLFYGIPK